MASEKVQRFVDALAPSAIDIGARYGLDPALIISQGALETGWGDSVAGNNYFGVKSHGKPGGNTVLTHEEVNGQMVPVYDSFRAYDGVAESMEDYARFLRDNPRYGAVFGAQGLENQIDAVAAAGYATDSEYANKLKAISRMFDLSPYMQGDRQPALAYNALPQVGPTGEPALNAINRVAPVTPTPAVMRPAPRQGGGNFWSNPLALMRSATAGMTAPIMTAATSPQTQGKMIAGMMGTLPGRNVIMRALMNQNVGPSPQIMQGHQVGGTRALAVNGQGASPVTIMRAADQSGSLSDGSNPSGMDKGIYRANAAVLGPGGFNQSNIDRAISGGKTLYKLA